MRDDYWLLWGNFRLDNLLCREIFPAKTLRYAFIRRPVLAGWLSSVLVRPPRATARIQPA